MPPIKRLIDFLGMKWSANLKTGLNIFLLSHISTHYFFLFAIIVLRVKYHTLLKAQLLILCSANTVHMENNRQHRLSHISIEYAVDGILWIDSKANIYRVNKAICHMLGFTQEELLSMTVADFGTYYKNRDFWDLWDKAKNGVVGFEGLLKNKNGQKIPVDISLNFVEFEGEWYACAFIRDISERKRSEVALQQSHARLQQALEGTITAIAKAVEARDLYVAGHQRRVAQLACAIAKEMGLTAEQIEGIHMGATIHDIGKIHLPAEILSKPAHLADTEFALVQSHSEVGYEILQDIEFPWPVAEIVYQHHEHLDGSGYPQGLAGNEILLEARIVCVADVVEAMAYHRPYRPALGIEKALDEIAKNKAVIYEPAAVEACCHLFQEKQFSFEAELQT